MKCLKSSFLILFFVFFLESGCRQKTQNPPNVILILVDDLGWSDLTSYGSSFYETPNIDRLAADGMKFTNAYSACPVCSPSRASILTGKNPTTLHFTGHITRTGKHRYPAHGRIIPPDDLMHVNLEEKMIAEALKEHGYATASIGKWHVGDQEKYFPTHQGFDVNIGGYNQGMPPTFWGPYKKPESDWNREIPTLKNSRKGEYLTDRLTDEAIKFIDEHKEGPFFVYLSHYAVHLPLEAPDSLVKKYERKMMSNTSQKSPVYAAMIESVDTNIGRLLDSLKSMGLDENTIIVFASDNGGEQEATTNRPLREGKGFLYEGGIRTPLIFKWNNRIKPGSVSDIPVISDDLYPTILSLTGNSSSAPGDIDGLSLTPVLFDKGSIERKSLQWYYPHYSPQAQMPGYAIREGNYKLIEYYDPVSVELYDLKKDIGEQVNLAGKMPERVKQMQADFATWLRKRNPVLHTSNPAFEPDYRKSYHFNLKSNH